MAGTTTDRRLGVNADSAHKVPVKAATSGNITLSGEQTIDGISCVTDDRVLVKDQTDGSENGIYSVDTSSWTRTPDFDGALDVVQGTSVLVNQGTANKGYWRITTADPITIGTTAIVFAATDADTLLREDVANGFADVNEWQNGQVATYIDATHFSVAGDQTATFIARRPIKGTGGSDVYTEVLSSVYTTLTTVTVPSYVTLDASMDTVYLGIHAGDYTSTSRNYWPLTDIEGNQGLTIFDVDFRYEPGNVIRYGADLTGVVDSSDAFNLATYSTHTSTGNFDQTFYGEPFAPPGKYKVTKTIYVHKGQHFKGAGIGSTKIDASSMAAYAGPVFKLGYSETGEDAGGLAPEISGLWCYGGPASYAFVYSDVSGCMIHDLFMSSPGIGLIVYGGDTLVQKLTHN